jgi:2-keto-3-deoxy-6-phosphogluconate aldolase
MTNLSQNVSAVLSAVRTHKLVAVIRAARADAALEAARAVIRGGIALVEVTYSVPDATSVMRQLTADAHPGVVVGAGTVLTEREAREAVAAGAKFLIAPNISDAVAGVARETGSFYCPGAYTTNASARHDRGAQMVKVHPVGVPAAAYIRHPCPQRADAGCGRQRTPTTSCRFTKRAAWPAGSGARSPTPRWRWRGVSARSRRAPGRSSSAPRRMRPRTTLGPRAREARQLRTHPLA